MGAPSLDESRERLLAPLADADDVTLVTVPGNLGDRLIEEGTELLLSGIGHITIPWTALHRVTGDVAVIVGSGGWCSFFSLGPNVLSNAEKRFRRVIVYPSSFDLSAPKIVRAVSRTESKLFAREWASYDAVDVLKPSVELAHDAAFFYPFRRSATSNGDLYAYRTDLEAAGEPIPDGNVDISLRARSLAEWRRKIATASTVFTDRAHVMIAAALMGKSVRYRPSRYFKLEALAATWLGEYDVERGEP